LFFVSFVSFFFIKNRCIKKWSETTNLCPLCKKEFFKITVLDQETLDGKDSNKKRKRVDNVRSNENK
jgi:hypothetical protein